MVSSMCLQSSQLTHLISLRHKPRAYNFCALEPNIPFWRVTYYPPIRKNLSFQILVSEAGCGSGHRELSGFLTLIFIGWSSNKCSSRVSRRSSDAKRAAKRNERRSETSGEVKRAAKRNEWRSEASREENGERETNLSPSPRSPRGSLRFAARFASLECLHTIQYNTIQYNTIQYNNLFKVVTQGVVAHSPEPGAHDKSARQASRRVTRARVCYPNSEQFIPCCHTLYSYHMITHMIFIIYLNFTSHSLLLKRYWYFIYPPCEGLFSNTLTQIETQIKEVYYNIIF